MEQQELFPLPNPCIGVCVANSKGYCKGCLRSRKERQLWLQLNNLQKRQVLHLCNLRRRKLHQLAHARHSNDISLPEQLDFGF